MKYVFDHDFHIHSKLSACSNDPEQTNERILTYAQEHGLKTICLTDHFWDEEVEGASPWYKDQDFSHISLAKPLPQTDGVRFLFGCETELDRFLTVGISKEKMDLFDFIIIPTTHLHMRGFTSSEEEIADAACRAKLWVKRLEAVLSMELPFRKIGLAHLTCGLIAPKREEYLETLSLIPEEDMVRLFEKAARLGVGIELNLDDMAFSVGEEELVLRPYRIAKKQGCKFYLGSDAHHPKHFEKAVVYFNRAIDFLELTEEDKFLL